MMEFWEIVALIGINIVAYCIGHYHGRRIVKFEAQRQMGVVLDLPKPAKDEGPDPEDKDLFRDAMSDAKSEERVKTA